MAWSSSQRNKTTISLAYYAHPLRVAYHGASYLLGKRFCGNPPRRGLRPVGESLREGRAFSVQVSQRFQGQRAPLTRVLDILNSRSDPILLKIER